MKTIDGTNVLACALKKGKSKKEKKKKRTIIKVEKYHYWKNKKIHLKCHFH